MAFFPRALPPFMGDLFCGGGSMVGCEVVGKAHEVYGIVDIFLHANKKLRQRHSHSKQLLWPSQDWKKPWTQRAKPTPYLPDLFGPTISGNHIYYFLVPPFRETICIVLMDRQMTKKIVVQIGKPHQAVTTPMCVTKGICFNRECRNMNS